MALDTSISGLLDEIRYAKSHRDKFTMTLKEDLKNFVGVGYKDGFGRNNPENHALEWFGQLRAECLMGNPRFRFVTDTPGDAQVRAQAYSYAVTNWSKQTRMRNLNERLLMNYGFRRAVCLVTSAPRPGFEESEDPPFWPAAYSIGIRHFLSDPAAFNIETSEWSAHLNIAMRSKLLDLAADKDSGWDTDALKNVGNQVVKDHRVDGNAVPERDEIAYWEVWCPNVVLPESDGPEKGYYGTIFTVIDNQPTGVGWIRKPMPYYGSRAGPYVIAGDYIVPDEAYPMGHIPAVRGQAEFVNRTVRSRQRANEAYKQLVFVRGNDDLPQKVKDGKDLYVFNYNGEDPRSNIVQVEIGGATQQHFAAEEAAHATLNRVSGLTQEVQGQPQGNIKATQAAIAAQAGQTRSSYNSAKFRDFIAEIGKRVGEYFARDHDIEQELPPEVTGGAFVKLKGGKAEGESPDEFENMKCSVEAGSMETDTETDAAQRLAMMQQTAVEVSPAGPLGPAASLYIDIQAYLDLKADLTGIHELKKLVDVQRMQALGMMQMMGPQGAAQQAAPPQPQDAPKPQVSQMPTRQRQSTLPQTMANKATSGPTAASPAKTAASKKLQGAGAGGLT